jgi:hypothetical protein
MAFALAAGCATGGDFPSLAPRPVELLSFEEPVRVDPAVASSPALLGRAGELLGRARSGEGAFEAAYARALPLVRSAGPEGSDAWVQAQEAISRAEAARVQTTSALAELDRLLVEQADEPTSPADWAQLRATREAAERLAADQQRRVAELQRSVG